MSDAPMFNGGHFKPYLEHSGSTLHNQNIFSSNESKDSKESLPYFSVQEPFDTVTAGTEFEMGSHFVVPF